ncbi:hypothetical protein MED121_19594 [Marinomonas sp. MED121]|uniref:zinc metallopeptidase n=1 Tax=Marinomonas sp. MED121 TaxID=314277 RepID=UPI0000690EF2|nr:zinc metallopeptidase [Marinomonas sp. MED121]EAQ64314.1 hypothetical protein MED121_19594 [Marinomonas sp. MED121]
MPILILALIVLILAPTLWVRYILKRYGKNRPDLAGTGSELAKHLLEKHGASSVKVESLEKNEHHYDPNAKTIRLGPQSYQAKSLTAVAVAAHEVGHALAYHNDDKVTLLSKRYAPLAKLVRRLALSLLMLWPVISVVIHIPYALPLHALVVFLSGFCLAFVYLAMLPEEWDASFNKALPILIEGRYLAPQDYPKIKKILTACALTYVAQALLNVLFFWRWFRR